MVTTKEPVTTADHRSAPRTGGRSARVVDAVHRAVTDLIGESASTDGITIPAVAARAGVNPTTVYRRWKDIDALLVEVALAAVREGGPVPDTGALRTDLEVWADLLVADITRPERVAFLRTLVAAVTDRRSHCLDKRERQVDDILRRARERGDSGVPTADDVLDHLIAPLYFRTLFELGGNGRADARRLVGELLRSAR